MCHIWASWMEAGSIPAGRWEHAVHLCKHIAVACAMPFSAVGYGDIVPWNALETAVTMVVQVRPAVPPHGHVLFMRTSAVQCRSTLARLLRRAGRCMLRHDIWLLP